MDCQISTVLTIDLKSNWDWLLLELELDQIKNKINNLEFNFNSKYNQIIKMDRQAFYQNEATKMHLKWTTRFQSYT